MDCYSRNCPFRVNGTGNIYGCECRACPNRIDGFYVFASNRTLTPDEIAKLKRQMDEDYGIGRYS